MCTFANHLDMRNARQMTISVITPVYNRADSLERCVRSVLTQDVPEGCEVELSLVDDGSSDGSDRLVREIAEANAGRVVFELFPENRGTNAARNAAIRNASGEFIVLLDSDDEMLPGAIAAMFRTVAEAPGFMHYMFATDDRAELVSTGGEMSRVWTFADFLLGRVGGDFVHLFRRSTALALPFDESLRIFEGVFFMRFYRLAGKVLFVNKVLYHRDRDRDDRVTNDYHLTNDAALWRKARSYDLDLAFFEDDYRKLPGGAEILRAKQREAYTLNVLGGDYTRADELEAALTGSGVAAPALTLTARRVRWGRFLWKLVRFAVGCKHMTRRVLNRRDD